MRCEKTPQEITDKTINDIAKVPAHFPTVPASFPYVGLRKQKAPLLEGRVRSCWIREVALKDSAGRRGPSRHVVHFCYLACRLDGELCGGKPSDNDPHILLHRSSGVHLYGAVLYHTEYLSSFSIVCVLEVEDCRVNVE